MFKIDIKNVRIDILKTHINVHLKNTYNNTNIQEVSPPSMWGTYYLISSPKMVAERSSKMLIYVYKHPWCYNP
jgi:hypothetical protein